MLNLAEVQGEWIELPTEWVARRWPSPKVSVIAAWAHRNADGRANGVVALCADGTVEQLLNGPLPLSVLREVMSIAHARLYLRSSGVRPAVQIADADLGASAPVVDLHARRRS